MINKSDRRSFLVNPAALAVTAPMQLGMEMTPSTPDGLLALMRSEKEKWEKVIIEARIKVQ